MFGQRRREKKLYKQWAKHAGLPPESIPQREIPKGTETKGREKGGDYRFKAKIVNLVKKILRVE